MYPVKRPVASGSSEKIVQPIRERKLRTLWNVVRLLSCALFARRSPERLRITRSSPKNASVA